MQNWLDVQLILDDAMPDTEIANTKAQRILNAARSVLARTGYAGTTINLVAREAGVSRGLLHYYFRNKEEMLIKVIQANMEASVAMVEDIFSRAESAEEISTQLIGALRNVLQTDPDFFNLFFEAWSVARLSPLVDDRLRGYYDDFRNAVENGLAYAAGRGIVAPALPVNGLAAVVTSIIDGFGLQLVTEPALLHDDDIWVTAERCIRLLLGEESAA